MIFLGPLYQPEMEDVLLRKVSRGLANASNQYQMDLLQGICANGKSTSVINVLPVGTWPKWYNELFLPDRKWQIGDCKCYEVGCVNLPFIKQWMRTKRISKVLKTLVDEKDEIIVYSPYLPFLKVIRNLPTNIGVTLIVTDLPEYYDLGKTVAIKKLLRRINNYYVYKCMARVDRYVLLTEKMKERLPVGNKPYTVVEGIWNQSDCRRLTSEEDSDKGIVFYAGTLHRQFGIMTLLEALKYLDNNTELWICGTGDCEAEVKKAALNDARIRFFGYISSDEVDKLRSQATVLVNPRPNEGEYTKYSFPSKTMGYMASGKLVVMNKLAGIPNEYDEFLFYPRDNSAEALANTLGEALSMSYEDRRMMGEKARKFVLENKNAVVQARKILEMINEF